MFAGEGVSCDKSWRSSNTQLSWFTLPVPLYSITLLSIHEVVDGTYQKAELVRMSSITKHFLDVTANNYVTFGLTPGEICALLGENGSREDAALMIFFFLGITPVMRGKSS